MSKLIIQKSFLVLGIVSLLLIGCASSSDSTKAANTNAPATISSTPEVKSMPVAIVEDGWGVNPRDVNALDLAVINHDATSSFYCITY